jgi:outer membrane cobalamin receptor
MRRLGVLWGYAAAAGVLASAATPAAVWAQTAVYTFNIPARDLGSELRAYAQITGQQLAFDEVVARGKRSSALVGTLSGDEALHRLLEGTGLIAQKTDAGVIVIRAAKSTSVAEPAPSSNRSESGALKPTALQDTAAPDLPRTEDAPTAAAAPAAEGDGSVQEVTVTGSRLQATGGFKAPTPVTVIDRESIQERAPANIADVLNQAPAFKDSNGDTMRGTGGVGTPSGPQNTLNLRGLGANRTLVLIDGRRVVATNNSGTVDTNIVPVGLVDHVEVVTGGASAAYGSDAVAGVVNIILKDKMQGINATAQTGMTEHGEGKQYTAGLSGGTAFADGRAHVIVGIDGNKSDAITDQYQTQSGANEIGSVTPTAAQRSSGGLPATYISNNVEPGTAAPGGLYQQSPTVAYTFDANGNPVRFNQGTVYGGSMIGSTANYGYNLNDIPPLRIGTSRIDGYGRLSFDFTEHVTAYAEASYGHDKTDPFNYGTGYIYGTGQTQAGFTIQRNNPYVTPAILALIPANATSFSLGRLSTDFGWTSADQDTTTQRYVGGVTGTFGKNWVWDVNVESGRTKQDFATQGSVAAAFRYAVNGCVTTGLSATDQATLALYNSFTGKTCQGFNPFGVGRNPASASNYFINPATLVNKVAQDVGAASLSGSPFAVPAGDVSLAVGAEAREEQLHAIPDPLTALGIYSQGNQLPISGQYHVKEGFVEVGVPVVKAIRFAESLDLNAAARRTDYELSGPVTTWKFGLTWDPFDPIRLRFTRSRDIRAPLLTDLYTPGTPNGNSSTNLVNTIPSGVVGANGTVNVNPLGVANTVAQPVLNTSAGNPNVQPEVAYTTTGGIIFQQNGFRASLDYYSINVTGAIGAPGGAGVIQLCRAGVATQCANIVFDQTVPGGIRIITNRTSNLNTLTVSGFDFEVDYRRPMLFDLAGSISLRALLNYEPENRTYNPLSGITTENADTLGALPQVAGQVNLGYQRDRLFVNVQFQGFGPMRGNPLLYNSPTPTILGPEDPGYDVTAANSVNKNRFAGNVYVNPSVEVAINSHLSIFGNIDNLFNVGPPALTVNSQYDYIGRRFRIGVRANFY